MDGSDPKKIGNQKRILFTEILIVALETRIAYGSHLRTRQSDGLRGDQGGDELVGLRCICRVPADFRSKRLAGKKFADVPRVCRAKYVIAVARNFAEFPRGKARGASIVGADRNPSGFRVRGRTPPSLSPANTVVGESAVGPTSRATEFGGETKSPVRRYYGIRRSAIGYFFLAVFFSAVLCALSPSARLVAIPSAPFDCRYITIFPVYRTANRYNMSWSSRA